MKIVINTCYGGFGISKEAAEYMANLGCPVAKAELEKHEGGKEWYGYGYTELYGGYDRTSPYLVKAVEDLGEKANGEDSKLKVVEIPDNIDYYIDDYDGMESIEENHRSWS